MKKLLLLFAMLFSVASFSQDVAKVEVDWSTKDIWQAVQTEDGKTEFKYVWPTEATVYGVYVNNDEIINPGKHLLTLKFHSTDNIPDRSKAEIKIGGMTTVYTIPATLKKGAVIKTGDTLLTVNNNVILVHNSSVSGKSKPMGSISEMLTNLWHSTGIYSIMEQHDFTLGFGQLVMIGVGCLLLWLAVVKGFEPLLLVPIGFGAILANIPLAGIAGPNGFLGLIYSAGVETGLFPLFIFMGVGAMTDFGPLIANPKTALLGAAAQGGIFFALIGAIALGLYVPGINFGLKEAASIGIIGGADGPTAIFLTSKLAPNLLGSIAVAAYSYMALVPIIQPPIMKLLTNKEERKIKMVQSRHVSKVEKICFPVLITLLCAALLPDATPLVGMLMFGNFMKECGVVERLSNTAQNAFINIVTILLGLTVGSKLSADKFLNFETLGILALGLVAFCIGTAAGVLLAKFFNKFFKWNINPLIGAAGVSAVPMAARVVNKVGLEDDPHNFLLMHAMGPNVAGVIGSAVAAGILLNALG